MSLSQHRSAITVGLGAIGCAVVLICTPAASPERVIAALLLGLSLPGTAVVRLLPLRDSGRAERLILAVGVSIALLILDSAVLYVVGVRLSRISWTWSLTAVTVLCAALSLANPRRRLGAPAVALRSKYGSTARASRAIVALAAVVAAALLAIAVLITARSVAHRADADHFTQLWALPVPARTGFITVGLYNHEDRSLRYILHVSQRGHLRRSQTVFLRSGSRWHETIGTFSGPLRFDVMSPGRHPVHRWVALRLGQR